MFNHIRPLKSGRFMDAVSLMGIIGVLFYFACMFVYPWMDGHGNWSHVEKVWYKWQALNVGMLAFASSVIALNISRFNAEKQRERNFLASKAFLPAALSELVAYLKSSASVLKTAWHQLEGQSGGLVAPELPKEYKSVFKDCITHAEPGVGNYLSNVLVWLQVHDARLRSLVDQTSDGSYVKPDKHNLITYFYRVGQLQALVGNLFNFARGESKFNSVPLVWEDFRNAYGNLNVIFGDIHLDDQHNLKAFTRRCIARDVGVDR
ncbi:MAG: hypothetical protein U1A22_12695 [Xanthomonadaceae bacterium]|nr:hypothetical protein [Xanthomonadaceae bacterium]